MQAYIVRRLLLFVPVLLLVSLIIFTVMRVAPGDVAILVLSGPEGEGSYSPEDLEKVRRQLGLDKPLVQQYVDWITGLVRLDAGISLYKKVPVMEEIGRRLPLTLELAVLTLLVSLALALPLGIISALRQNTWLDYLIRVVSIGGITMPSFWVGSLIILFLVLAFRWLPPMEYVPLTKNPGANLLQLAFPALAMGYFYAAVVSRMTRSTMLEVLRQDYVRTAWSKGLSERLVVVRHALKNALLPVITISGFQFGTLLGGTVIMEFLFALPGLGSALIDGITFRDYPMVQTIVLLVAIFFSLVNLGVDLVYGLVDPRIRYR
ncbi:MAG: ABC transporter permease [Chloroflexi bacterium]|nr:ABC transporter permease [Chloroflexota bacterium]